jgi:hypothetical protein
LSSVILGAGLGARAGTVDGPLRYVSLRVVMWMLQDDIAPASSSSRPGRTRTGEDLSSVLAGHARPGWITPGVTEVHQQARVFELADRPEWVSR